MAAIEGIGQSKLGEYIQSKLTERDPGGVPQAHAGDSDHQTLIYVDVDDGGVYMLEAGATGIAIASTGLDSITARSFANAPDQAYSIATTTNYIFVGAMVLSPSFGPGFLRLAKSGLGEKSVNITEGGLAVAMRRLSASQVLGVGSRITGCLMVIEEDATLSALHEYTVITSFKECVVDSGSVWAIGTASGVDYCYVQLDTTNFDVQRSKGVTIPELAETPKAVAIHGTSLILLGNSKTIVAINTATDTVLWSTRISDAAVTLNDVAISDSGVYAIGEKSGDFLAIKFDKVTGAILAKNRVPLSGAASGTLIKARHVAPDLWLCGYQDSETFGLFDHQVFRVSDISDTGESLTTSTITPSIANTSTPVKSSLSTATSVTNGTSTSKSYSIAETTFAI